MQSAVLPDVGLLTAADLCSVTLPSGWSAPLDDGQRVLGREVLGQQQLLDDSQQPLADLRTALGTLVDPILTVSISVGRLSGADAPPTAAADHWASVVALSQTHLTGLLRRADVPLVEVTTGSPEELEPALQRLFSALPVRAGSLEPVVIPWDALQTLTSDRVFSLDGVAEDTRTPTHTIEQAAAILAAVELSVSVVVVGDRSEPRPPIGQVIWYATDTGWFTLQPAVAADGTPLAVLSPADPRTDRQALTPLLAEALR